MPIKLNSTGGGAVSIDVPSTASTYTLTAPARSGTIITSADANTVTQAMVQTGFAGNGPSFAVYQSISQTIGASWAKVQFNVEEWDTANCFDSTTNYRFTPNVAGYYQINCNIRPNNNYNQYTALWKNGSAYRWTIASSYMFGAPLSTLVYCNGTTDYLEIYYYSATSISTIVASGTADTWWNGYLARSA